MTLVSTARHRAVLGHDTFFCDLHKEHDFCEKYRGNSYAFLAER